MFFDHFAKTSIPNYPPYINKENMFSQKNHHVQQKSFLGQPFLQQKSLNFPPVKSEYILAMYQGVSKNYGFSPPNHPFVYRVFHYFHHPFWGEISPYFWKHLARCFPKDRCDFSFHFELGPIAINNEFDSSTKKAYDLSGWAAKQAVWLWEKNGLGAWEFFFWKPKISI